ncbi:MAG: hypothetical protein AAGE43_16565 [Pseudomonadota bacterium]
MSRGLVTFLVFLVLLVGGFATVTWLVGPTMVSLALDDERRETPFYLVHLLDAPDASGYFQRFGPLLREEQGQLLWRGGLRALHAGRSEDELTDMALIGFDAGAGLVQMLTSSAYRQLTDSTRPLLLGTPQAPGPIAQDETLVLWLLEASEERTAAELEPLAATAGAYNGQLIWSTPVVVLDGDRPWNYVLLLAFPDGEAVTRWLEDPGTGTDRALGRRHYLSDAMLELRAG